MRLPGAYRSLARPSSAPEPSHPPDGVAAALYAQAAYAQPHWSMMLLGSYQLVSPETNWRNGPGGKLSWPAFEPTTSALQGRRSSTDLPAHVAEALAKYGAWWAAKYCKGGDPSAGSPTDTLLRLSPARRAWVRVCQAGRPSPRPDSLGLTGGVCKEQGHIHRAILRRDYYGIHLHEGEFQPSVRTTTGFRD